MNNQHETRGQASHAVAAAMPLNAPWNFQAAARTTGFFPAPAVAAGVLVLFATVFGSQVLGALL